MDTDEFSPAPVAYREPPGLRERWRGWISSRWHRCFVSKIFHPVGLRIQWSDRHRTGREVAAVCAVVPVTVSKLNSTAKTTILFEGISLRFSISIESQ
jgi:hypothetical protein